MSAGAADRAADDSNKSPSESVHEPPPTKPTVLVVVDDGIPAELKERDQWVCWKLEHRPAPERSKGGKPWTKVPFQPDGRSASTKDPTTWSNFDTAWSAYQSGGFDGIGFVLSVSDPYFGLDLDDVLEKQSEGAKPKLDDQYKQVLKTLATYTEFSVSGTGLHAIGIGTLPEGRRKRGPVEMYDRARYFTVTGHVAGVLRIRDCSDVLNEVHAALLPEGTTNVMKTRTDLGKTGTDDDEALLHRARSSANAAKFCALYDEGKLEDPSYTRPYASESEADIALCGMLLFWTHGDRERCDRLFRRSNLMRPKWDEQHGAQTYGEMTVGKAFERWERGEDRPPLEVEELRERHERKAERSDSGNAQLLVRRYGRSWAYDPRQQRDLLWLPGGHRWVEPESPTNAPPAILVRAAMETATFRLRHAPESGEDARAEAKWAIDSRSNSRLRSAIQLGRALPPVDHSGVGWDGRPGLLAVANGIVDLRTGDLRAGRRGDFITRGIAVDFVADARCDRFDQFMDEVFLGRHAIIDFVWRAIGYTLTGENREHRWFLLHGRGRNGKGTLLEVLRELLGSYHQVLPFRAIEAGAYYRHPAETATLAGKRLAIIDESSEQARMDEGTVKKMTGGGPELANPKYKRPFEYEQRFKLWVATNYLPVVTDDSPSFWERILLIPFERVFEGHERDQTLVEKLHKEIQGILAKAVRASAEWYRDGLRPPDEIRAATDRYRGESDDIGRFIEDLCVRQDGLRGRSERLYTAFSQWSLAEGIRPQAVLSQKAFSAKMKNRFAHGRDRDGAYFEDIMLRENG